MQLLNVAGDYRWKSEAGPQLDFARLTLNDDGTYTASVNATLVNPRVQSFRAPCMLPEQGLWSIFEVQGKTKLRVRPTTSCARVYGVAFADNQLSIGRRGESTVLSRDCQLVTLGQVA